jgi:hypothetical protein
VLAGAHSLDPARLIGEPGAEAFRACDERVIALNVRAMVHRVFRLSISPERAPDVRRVVDFDGRAALHDVHDVIQRELDLDDDHLYAFYLSGKYFDRASEHSLSPDSPHDSGRSALFRLGLTAGQQFAYLFDFGDEHRHTVTVVSIADVDAPLSEPVLVESVGEPPPQYDDVDEAEEPYELPEYLEPVAPLAEAVLALSEQLDELYAAEETEEEGTAEEPSGPPEAIVSLLRELSKAALALAGELEQDAEALHELDEWSQGRELLPRLLELPLGLVSAGELDSALAVARAFTFAEPESCNGDIAVILAEGGKQAEAKAQLESNLKQFPESYLAALKAGAALEALGDDVAAEASYRKALALAQDDGDEEGALNLLVEFLEERERFEEADALLAASGDVPQLARVPGFIDDLQSPVVNLPPSAARNDPCPCGSGKKYKKCHGA